MKHRKRIYYTDTQKALMWDCWQHSKSLNQIAPMFDRHHSAVRKTLAEHGGIRPPVRQESPRMFSLAEREEISRRLAVERSIRMIAALIGRATSTISREIGRNEGLEGYRTGQAGEAGTGHGAL